VSPESRADIARARAGDVAFVRLTPFVEFEDGSGHQRWNGTPQGPYPIALSQPATSTLLGYVDSLPNDLLEDLGIAGVSVSRFAFRAAPRRLDLEPGLADLLLPG